MYLLIGLYYQQNNYRTQIILNLFPLEKSPYANKRQKWPSGHTDEQ